jgi:hypothetical protein
MTMITNHIRYDILIMYVSLSLKIFHHSVLKWRASGLSVAQTQIFLCHQVTLQILIEYELAGFFVQVQNFGCF